MRRIAHLSDVHLLDPRVRVNGATARYRFAARFVSLGRSIDPRGRAKRLSRGLAAAKAGGADHVVISGDLTELGEQAEFESLAEVLDGSGFDRDSVTLVPGNHDAYGAPGAWSRAMAGPLRAYASGSAAEPGKLVDRGDVALLPIDTSRFQSMTRAGGDFSPEAARAVEERLSDPALSDKAVVMVVHHPPQFLRRRTTPLSAVTAVAAQWVDGLRGGKLLLDLFTRHPRLSILHGHLHRVVDWVLGHAVPARAFGAPAVVEDGDVPRVRVYDVREGALESAGLVPAALIRGA